MTRDEAQQIIHDIIDAAILNVLWDDLDEAKRIQKAAEIFFDALAHGQEKETRNVQGNK